MLTLCIIDATVRKHDQRGIQKGTKGFCDICGSGNDKERCKQAFKQANGSLKGILASVEGMTILTGMEVGWVTPFSLSQDLKLYVDSKVMELDWVILLGGKRDLKLKISPEVFHQLGTEIVENLALPINLSWIQNKISELKVPSEYKLFREKNLLLTVLI